MSKKTAKAINSDMMMLLTYFMWTCYFLLNSELSIGQQTYILVIYLVGSLSMITAFVLMLVSVWKNSRSEVKKPLIQINPKSKINSYLLSSFSIGFFSFYLFIKTIVDDNQVPYIGYLTFLLFLIICYILKVNKRYYREEQEI